jgi:hypothetical protein
MTIDHSRSYALQLDKLMDPVAMAFSELSISGSQRISAIILEVAAFEPPTFCL